MCWKTAVEPVKWTPARCGFLRMNFPGKYRLERWLVTRPSLLKSLNAMRERRGRPPFRVP